MRRTLLTAAVTLVVIGSAETTAEATFPGRNGPIAFRRFDPATHRLSLMRALPDGTHVTELTDRPGLASDWRADGQRIAFDFFEPNSNEQIATMTAKGSDLRPITSGRGIHEFPSWSPDGSRIVFDYSPEPDPNAPGFQTQLWTMRPDGDHARALPMSQPGFDVEPRYSPNGRWIAFGRLRFTPAGAQEQAVFVIPADGGVPHQLTPWKLKAEHPTWSPDSRWITFNAPVTFDEPESSIQAIRPDGTGRRTILPVTQGFGGHKPWFSPDGSRILFMCAITDANGHGNEDICVMNADGSAIVNLTNTPNMGENLPSWGPAPSRPAGPRTAVSGEVSSSPARWDKPTAA